MIAGPDAQAPADQPFGVDDLDFVIREAVHLRWGMEALLEVTRTECFECGALPSASLQPTRTQVTTAMARANGGADLVDAAAGKA